MSRPLEFEHTVANRKTSSSAAAPRPTTLLVPRADIEVKLDAQIQSGRELRAKDFRTKDEFTDAQHLRTRWNDYNFELLKQSFDPETMAEDYHRVGLWGSLSMNADISQQIASFRDGLGRKISALESVKQRLELLREPASPEPSANAGSAADRAGQPSDSVFVVHGSNEAVKESVARLIEKLALKAIVLHEAPNEGRTIIEKFEHHAARAGFAAVLLTGDDVGAPRSEIENLRLRARQNVVLELGYFSAKLGRGKTCVLYEEGVELPSDMAGVVYVALDAAGAWRLRLAAEMKTAGLPVDLNNVA